LRIPAEVYVSDNQNSSLTFSSEYQKILERSKEEYSDLRVRSGKQKEATMQSTDWPQEHSRALRELHARGMSYGEIAAEMNARFGTSYTRNAVLGRGKRMGFVSSEAARDRQPPRRLLAKAERAQAQTAHDRRLPIVIPPVLPRAEPVQLRCVGISPRLISLTDLEPGDCRYPYGGDTDGDPIVFCGHPRQPGSCYCTPHFHLTRNPEGLADRPLPQVVLRLVAAA
jgi:GcrA cell cycle regulator